MGCALDPGESSLLAHLHPKGECRNTVSNVDLITAKMTKLPGVIKPC